MLYSGLVSITFKQLSAAEIVSLVSKARLGAIEWGGNIHVPHGNVKIASEVKKLTHDHGLKTCSYGSYYLVGEKNAVSFENVLDCAIELDAPTIRVWPGKFGADIADETYRCRVIKDSQRIAALAAKAGKTLCYEFHPGYLTETAESTIDLLKRIDLENFATYWQYRPWVDSMENANDIKMLLPWIRNVHAYYLDADQKRLALSEGKDDWDTYIKPLRDPKKDFYILLEMVKNNDPLSFLQDADTLRKMIA